MKKHRKPKALSNKTALLMLPVVMMSMGLSACGQKQAMQAPPPAPVVVEQLTDSPIADSSDYVATLISRKSVSLQSQVAGQIESIYVTAGDSVPAGKVLMLIDPDRQAATVQSAAAAAQSQRAQIAQAQQNVRALEEQRQALVSAVETSQSQYSRFASLAEQKSASRQDVENYLNQLNQARASLEANEAQIAAQRAAVVTAQRQYQQAQAATQEQRVQLQYYKITAPFSGIVGDIPVRTGNYIQPQTPLLSVTDNRRLEVNISVPAERFTDLRVGLPVEILDANHGVVGRTTLSFVSPQVDEMAQTVLVKAILPNGGGSLKADQIVNARLIWRTTPGLRIPTQSVVHMGGRDFVYVVQEAPAAAPGKAPAAPAPQPAKPGQKNYVARQIPITVGRIEGPYYVVEQGLQAGQTLVTSGLQKLADGAPIVPMTAAQMQQAEAQQAAEAAKAGGAGHH